MTSKPLKPSATRPYPSSSNCTRLGTSAFKFGTSKYKCVPFNFNLFSGYRQLNSTLYMYLYQSNSRTGVYKIPLRERDKTFYTSI